jgi:two-component system CheB/CheR fusion protein
MFPVVGVGASAGGLEAFTRLLKSLASPPGVALLLVQHLDPTRDSMLAEILTRETELPVILAVEGQQIEVNRIYVIPPDTRMGARDGRIHLEPRGERATPHLPIDHLFQSLAKEFGSRAVGIVLSGGGSDGALGLGDIREAGGVTFAQDEASSGQTGMPASAFAAGSVDAVLPPEEIAAALERLIHRAAFAEYPGAFGEIAPSESTSLTPLFSLLRVRTGVDFAHYKQNTIRRRVHRRMSLRDYESLEDLVKSARDDANELAALSRDLLIGVTRFFRDPEIFERLRQAVLPTLIRDRDAQNPLRIWVPGCSTGEEAYSIAMILSEAMGDAAAEIPVKLLATDLNDLSLAKARAGIYPENIAVDVTPERLRRFFRKVEGGYRICPAIRDLCVFARHDLTTDPPFARMDLISCRNVLIYFDSVLQRRVIPLFHYALRAGGYLMLGPSESLGASQDLFTPLGRDEKIFTRSPTARRVLPGLSVGPTVWPKISDGNPPASLPRESGGVIEIQREADRLLSRFAPAGVLIDEQLNIIQFRGDTDPYVRHPAGTAGLELTRMLRDGLLGPVRDAIGSARSGSATIRRPGIILREGDRSRTVNLEVIPLATGAQGHRCFLVLFEESTGTAKSHRSGVEPSHGRIPHTEASPASEQILHLRQEVEAGRENQQALIEEYEATTEELKSANEEILASNEELQSTNEELQTAKEELQSTNEELETVNEELSHRNRELGRANDDLRSLLVGVNAPVIVVGRDLCIRRMTLQAEAAFGLAAVDVGKPLREVSLGLEMQTLRRLVGGVIDTLEAASFEARDRQGRWHLVRIRPYETLDNRIDGAVITAIDIHKLKQTEESLRTSRDFGVAVLDAVQVSLVVLETDFTVRSVNRFFERSHRLSAFEVVGQNFFKLGGGVWDTPLLRERLSRISSGQPVSEEIELELSFPGVEPKCLLINIRPLIEAATAPLLLLAIEDVTAERRTEKVRHDLELKMYQAQKLESLGLMAGGIAHDLNNLLMPILGYAELARIEAGAESTVGRHLKEVDQSTRLAIDLIQQLLAYSGKNSREVRVVDLSDSIVGIKNLLERAVSTRAELHFELTGDALPVEIDSAQWSQVAINLVTNAAESIGERPGVVTVRTFSIRATESDLASAKLGPNDLPEGMYAVLEVSDNGGGISDEAKDRIFEPFYSTKFTGRGLGLAAVMGIVRGHRGTISVTSGPQGSTFRVWLPLSGRDAAMMVAPPVAPLLTNWRGSGTIMVVDDESAIRQLISMVLREAGFTVLEAEDGEACIEMFHSRQDEVRAVILDLTMPGRGGVEVAGVLWSLKEDLPIVLMSGYSMEDFSIEQFRSNHAATQKEGHPINCFLRKPFTPQILLGTLKGILG